MAFSLRRTQATPPEDVNELRAARQAALRRRAFVGAVLGASLLVLIALNAASWLFVRRMSHYLDNELGRRLQTVAQLASRTLDREGFNYLRAEDRTLLALELWRLRRDAQLQAVHVIDPDCRLITSSQPYLGTGETLHHLRSDSQAVEQALRGETAAAPLRQIQDNRFKVAFAPLHDSSGTTVALLAIEANAEFFELLRLYDRARLVGLAASAILLVFLGASLLWSISSLLRTEASLRRAERLATMGQLAATVAHEIRNPLGIIKSTADVLRQRYCPHDRPEELFDFIPQEVGRLNRLVDNFLLLSRGPRLALEHQRAQEVIGKTVERLRPEFQKAGVALALHMDPDLPAFPFDQDALQQMLLNLLLNALQATPSGGTVTVRANLHHTKGGEMAYIAVRDTGSGIRGDLSRVFEPFYTTKSSGSGLGLAVTKRLVEAHGGWIEVHSRPEVGSTFSLYLPLRAGSLASEGS